MHPQRFLADLERKPAILRAAAACLAAPFDGDAFVWPLPRRPRRVLLIGMGSSLYAAQVAALRLRVAGIDAVAESGAADATSPVTADDLVVGISAGGASVETNTLFDTCAAAQTVALTNVADSAITRRATATVLLHAQPEVGGVACRSYTHTLVALLALEQQLTGRDLGLADIVRRAADATDDLLSRRSAWLPETTSLLAGPHGSWMVAPLERLSSAMQSALMMREGPRVASVGCETGDWSHVDVYLTRTLDYRAVVFPGSRWDATAAEWLSRRRATVLAVGGAFPGADSVLRYVGDDDPLVRLLTETTVAELVAAELWSQTTFPEEPS